MVRLASATSRGFFIVRILVNVDILFEQVAP